MRHQLVVAACSILLSSQVSTAATSDPYIGSDPGAHLRNIMVGCTLGTGEEFPKKLQLSYMGTGQTQSLDVELTLYVRWIMDTDNGFVPVEVYPPKPITDPQFSAWFSVTSFTVSRVEQEGVPLDREYTPCTAGTGLVEPALYSTLLPGGKLRVKDRQGGVGDRTVVELFGSHGVSPHQWKMFLYVGWEHPGTRFDDAVGESFDFRPGETWMRKVVPDGGGWLGFTHVPMRIVQWVSTDMKGSPTASGPSPRFTDAGDVASFAQTLGVPIRWGFEDGTGGEDPDDSPTYHGDYNTDGFVDGGDVALLSNALGTNNCSTSKATPEAEVAAIMSWFGFAATGRRILANPATGEDGPEYLLADIEQQRRGIADPYGYQRGLAAASVRSIPWSQAKALYR